MKLKSLTVKNIRSFAAEKRIDFNDDFTILIGPNGGGKSNILDIITITLRQFLLAPWGVTRESDLSGPFYQFRTESPFGNIHQELPKHYGATEPSRISLEFQLSEEDVTNIALLIDRQSDLHQRAEQFRGGEDRLTEIKEWKADALRADDLITFEVHEGVFALPTDPKSILFHQYLQLFNKLAILLENQGVRLTTPFVHFPPYRAAPPDGLRMSLASQSRWNIEIGSARATSRQTSSLIPLGTFHFAAKHRQLEVDAHSSGYEKSFWNDDEVERVSKTLKSLGYDWDLELKDPLANTYEILLKRDGQQFEISSASSGEKEIINFVFGIYALNIRNGLVIIDEPELHLHPKWQRLLYAMFEGLHETTGNQFILATHSPSFITSKTLGTMTRVARAKQQSELTKLDAGNLAGRRDLLQMINSHNNEKLFFSDIVVLVEGIQDRILFEALLRLSSALPLPDNGGVEIVTPPVIEVLEVHGKGNFAKYSQLLESANITNYIIADRDYAEQVGRPEIKALFQKEPSKAIGVLLEEKTLDRESFGQAVDEAVANGDIKGVREIWNYILDRSKRFKAPLAPDEEKAWTSFVKSQQAVGTFILALGRIEDYLPDGYTTLDKTIELVALSSFKQLMALKAAQFGELERICAHINLNGVETQLRAIEARVGPAQSERASAGGSLADLSGTLSGQAASSEEEIDAILYKIPATEENSS